MQPRSCQADCPVLLQRRDLKHSTETDLAPNPSQPTLPLSPPTLPRPIPLDCGCGQAILQSWETSVPETGEEKRTSRLDSCLHASFCFFCPGSETEERCMTATYTLP